MSDNTWHFTNNQFESGTRTNYKRANILTNDHLSKLTSENADVDIAALVTRTLPLSVAYNTRYSSWISASGTYKGHTQLVDGMLLQLSNTKIKQWDIQIQSVYLEGTGEYTMLLPNRRAPFQQGTKDDRLSNVEALAQTLLNYPALAATQADVVAFGTALRTARDNQQQKEQLVSMASDLLEQARLDICTMMYGNLGVLMDKYRDTPAMIENFWQLDLIRRTGQGNDDDLPATGAIISGKVTNMALNTVLANALVRVYETGGDPSNGIEAFTNELGIYTIEIPDVPSVINATLDAQLVGYATQVRNLTVSPGGSYLSENFSLMQMP